MIYETIVYLSGALWCSPSRSVMVARLNGCQSSETSGFGALPRGADKYSRRWHGTHGHLEFERSLSPIHALEACMHGCTETLFDQTLPQTRNKCSKSRSRHGPQWAPVSRQQDVCQGPSHIARTRACTKHERLCCLNIFNI